MNIKISFPVDYILSCCIFFLHIDANIIFITCWENTVQKPAEMRAETVFLFKGSPSRLLKNFILPTQSVSNPDVLSERERCWPYVALLLQTTCGELAYSDPNCQY